MLLLCVVIGVVYVSLQVRPDRLSRKTKRLQRQEPDKYPWTEQWRIKSSREKKPWGLKEGEPHPLQPKLVGALEIYCAVTEDSDERGGISITIQPDGILEGNWTADYEMASPRSHHMVSARFKGNTDPGKVCIDPNGSAEPKLFLIGRGNFFEVDTDYNSSVVKRVGGEIYVVGWLEPDMKMSGRIHITEDKRSQRIFQWSGQAQAAFGIFTPTKSNWQDAVRQALEPHDPTAYKRSLSEKEQ
jgi:hypothetical protein